MSFLLVLNVYLSAWSGSEKNHVLANMHLIPFKNVLLQQSAYYLKVVSTTFLLLCFLSLKKGLVKLGKMFFISLQKLFPSVRKSKFRTLDI